MENDRPIVFTITRSDEDHVRIWSNDNRVDFQVCASRDRLSLTLESISEKFSKQGYVVEFEVDK